MILSENIVSEGVLSLSVPVIHRKPKLSLDGQIEHLKEKGITFTIMDEDDARDYLQNNNNYFKLTAYRKNYDKYPAGEKEGQYIHLEFAYLKDLAVIDMRLRYRIVHMALDIEHHAKLQLLQKLDLYGDDGYECVTGYQDSLSERQKGILDSEITRNKNSIYSGDIIAKYYGDFPVWAFIEVIPFGRLVDFYKFVGAKYSDKEMTDNFYRLLTCKEIRNAAAHSSCILNDLHTGTAKHRTNNAVTRELSKISGMSAPFRKLKMSNAHVQEIVTLLYMHKNLVTSSGLHKSEAEALQRLEERMFRNIGYYDDNPLISGTFDFLKLVIDSWFVER